MSFSLMPSDLSAPEGDLVQRRTDLEGVLDRKRLTIQAIATIRSDQHNQIEVEDVSSLYIIQTTRES